MIPFTLLSIFFAVFTAATTLDKRDPKVIRFDFKDTSSLVKRDGGFASGKLNYNRYVFTDLEVGSNRDVVTLMVDTGSWLTTIFDTNVTCSNNDCKNHGLYNSSSSKTVVKSGKPEKEVFGSGEYYAGEYVKELVYFNGMEISNFTIVDVYNVNVFVHGILALSKPYTDRNQHIVWAAKYSGAIDKAMYSLNILNPDDTPGSLIIGGYDAAKLDGEINWRSIKNANIIATLAYVKFNGETIPVNRNYTIDTGGIRGYLPQAAYDKFIGSLPEDPNNPDPLTSRTFDCSLAEGHSFTYNLNGVDYEIPLKAILKPGDKGQHCNISLGPGLTAQLGPEIFRYLFVAVDLEKDMVGLANIKNTTESDIRAF